MIFDHEITTGSKTGDLYQTDGSQFAATLDPLDDHRTHTITLTLQGGLITSSSVSIAVQNEVKMTYSRTGSLTFTVDPKRPVKIAVSGYSGRLAISLTSSGNNAGPHRLAVLAYIPRPEYVSAILDACRLDQFTLPDPATVLPWFRLDESYLDHGVLEETPNLLSWRNIIDPATEIEITRGISYNGMTGKGETGILTMRIYNALDPRASGLIRGTQIIVQDTTTRTPLFTGAITATSSRPAKDGSYTVTITAADRGYQLAQTTKYQDTRPSPTDWITAANSLLKDHPATITGSTLNRPQIGSVVREASLTEYLDMVCATVGATWWINRYGAIEIHSAVSAIEECELVADTPSHTALPVLSLSDADAEFDTSNVISHIEATNHEAEKEPDGWQDHTRTVRATSTTNLATYGDNRITIDTVAAQADALETLLNAYVTQYSPNQVINRAVVTPWAERHHIARDEEITTIVGLDIMTAVATSYRGESATQHITAITHRISPETWQTSLNLTQWRQ
ncbi:hypothetical protein [Trueperella pyogenes]|uniref:hypothetical protein n=1 Tax=Trueperella pyogenes TaxID=1661 RepID=UPI0006B2409A|nr:hypothetical protein [Trueperella pyogenes]ALD74582.1 hypothetical protein AN946_10070 [Trueperella pyogenes]